MDPEDTVVADSITDTATDKTADTAGNTDDNTNVDIQASTDGDDGNGDGSDQDSSTAGDGNDDEPVSLDDLEFPEGAEVNDEILDEFKALVTENKWSKEDAQKLIALQSKMNAHSVEQWSKQFEDWKNEIFSDKELGGKDFAKVAGPKVASAINKFGSPELAQLMTSNPMYGNNPHLVRFLAKVGETITEDTLVTKGRAGQSDQKDHASILYPEN